TGWPADRHGAALERQKTLIFRAAAAFALACVAPLSAAAADPTAPSADQPSTAPSASYPPAQAPASASAPAPDSKAMAEAKERYVRALELVAEGAYDAALLEFKRAYALAPTYKLYYNMAVVSQRL